MRMFLLTGVLVASVGVMASSQTPTPGGIIPSTMSADSNVEKDGVFYAKGNVRILIGGTMITADEATIRRGSGYRIRDVELRGNVHMVYQLDHD